MHFPHRGRQEFTGVNDLARIPKITQQFEIMTHRPVYIWPDGHIQRHASAGPASVIFDLRSFIRFTPRQCKPAGSLPARLLRIFGLTAIYTVHASAMQACRLIACQASVYIWPDGHIQRHALAGPAPAYIWPGGHLYCSRLGNASLPAFVKGSFCSFHETGGLLSAAK